jgi:hypothetical protein
MPEKNGRWISHGLDVLKVVTDGLLVGLPLIITILGISPARE